jgi:hypothetical protein
MGDHLSPIIEGFSNPTMDSIIQILKTNSTGDFTQNLQFLKSLVQQQRELADSLMSSAKKISPVSQNIASSEQAYDAAFESDVTAPIPNISGTLQGFTLVFFTLSFFSLAIIATIHISRISTNNSLAVYAFLGFILIFFAVLVFMPRFH